jgi:hypothetical protein
MHTARGPSQRRDDGRDATDSGVFACGSAWSREEGSPQRQQRLGRELLAALPCQALDEAGADAAADIRKRLERDGAGIAWRIA